MLAAVDLGSNSFRLHVGSCDGRVMRVVHSVRDPVRLGSGLDGQGDLTDEAIASAIASLTQFRKLLATFTLDAVRVVATSTFRVARNAQAFLPKAEAALGYPIEIISGREEASLIYAGVASTVGIPRERRIVIDIGGGSTEIIVGEGHVIDRAESIALGTIDQARTFFRDGRIDPVSFDAAVSAARSSLMHTDSLRNPLDWTGSYGSSGTIRAIASIIARNGIGDGVVSRRSLEDLKVRFLGIGHINRIRMPGLRADRVPAVLGGITILLAVTELFEIHRLQPVQAGLRAGVMWNMHSGLFQFDRREQSVRQLLTQFRVDDVPGLQVARVASMLHAQLAPGVKGYADHLYWSARLHSIGMAVSRSGHHKHAAYLIANAQLPGYSGTERRTMSSLVIGQKGNLQKVRDILHDADFAKAILAMRLAVIFYNACPDAGIAQVRIAKTTLIRLQIPASWLQDYPDLWARLVKEKNYWRKAGMEFSLRVV